MSTIDIQSFRSLFHGQVFEPTDVGYDEARQIWNASVSKHPKVIARCSGVADVIAAVDFGRANNLPTAIRSGGHKVCGRWVLDGRFGVRPDRKRSIFLEKATRRSSGQSVRSPWC